MTQNQNAEITRLNARLKALLLHRMPEPGLCETAVAGLRLSRRNESGKPEHCFYKPLVSITIQGVKRALMGSSNIEYGENQSLVVGVDMPNAFQVTGASPDCPFLAVGLHLDKQLTAQLMAEIELPPMTQTSESTKKSETIAATEETQGFSVTNADANLLDAFARLVELLDTPARVPVLAPMLVREIHYLLLTGPQGAQLRCINTFGSQSNQVSRAISWMRENFTAPVQIDDLAHKVNMATSTFHRHFKDITTLSPLQYLKRLRLYEAQRLMLVERHDATSAGLAVGYESATQFNREYKRLFGEPPLRDVRRMQ